MLPTFNKICIYGVGLMGGSLALACKKSNPKVEIIGSGRNQENLQQAQSLGIIDSFTTDLAVALEGIDLLVFAVPVGTMQTEFERVAPYLTERMILTDVGSTKVNVVAYAQTIFKRYAKNFVPGHPIAGTERSGAGAAFAELFEQRRVILTPTGITDTQATQRITALWQACGAEVLEMPAEHHDEVLAATSHLPHMLAFSLVDTLSKMNDKQEIFKYAAGGFRDFTRIASSSPEMWQDICLANADPLIAVIERFQNDLSVLTKAIASGDKEKIFQTFQSAKIARDQFSNEL
ncbi:prephenate dehydrogenase/arogenate dehydrogenase family protein [Beggiatoa alba]|nr:prephenate dehydrogenase/arogenate dehydrogenase family protein [Beggiatoa alba]